jgi:hypothetical protein
MSDRVRCDRTRAIEVVAGTSEEVAVSAGGARRGRRDNGLDAAEYVAAGDVDPRVGEHLLDVLAAGGIAAYLQPAADLNPVTRTTTMPPRPTDRLYVDRAHLGTARDYLSRLAAESGGTPAAAPAGPDVDAEWARIVASFETEVDDASRPWPAAEHIDAHPAGERTDGGAGARTDGERTDGERTDGERTDGERTDGDAGDPRRARPRAGDAPTLPGLVDGRNATEPSLLDGLDTFGADLADEEEEEGYTPPPPPPLPRISKYAVSGVLGVIGGFVVFLFPQLLPIDRDVALLLGFAAILAGFVTLIWRLRPGDDEDDYDPDDGAKV